MGVEEGYVNWAVILGKALFFIGISWNPLGTLQDYTGIPWKQCPWITRAFQEAVVSEK